MNVIPHTSDRMLRESARLFAVRGFHGTSIEDIGTACGTSGPAIYKHFSSKLAILAALLLDISRQLVEGGRQVVEEAGQADRALMALITFHAVVRSQRVGPHPHSGSGPRVARVRRTGGRFAGCSVSTSSSGSRCSWRCSRA